MPIQVTSDASTDKWRIDSASHAGRVSYYNDAGQPLNRAFAGMYMLPINFVTSSSSAVPQWAMRVDPSATRKVYVMYIGICINTFQNAMGGVERFPTIMRFTSTTPAGGTVITPIALDNSYPTSVITNARQGLLSVSGVAYTDALIVTSIQEEVSAEAVLEYSAELDNPYSWIVLNAGESLGIIDARFGTSHCLSGCFIWGEA